MKIAGINSVFCFGRRKGEFFGLQVFSKTNNKNINKGQGINLNLDLKSLSYKSFN